MSRKLNLAKLVTLSQMKGRSLSRPIASSKQATEMKQKATYSCSNLAADSKGNRAVTAELQVSEDSDFQFEKFTFIWKLVLQW